MINGRMVEDQHYIELIVAKIRLVAAQTLLRARQSQLTLE